MPTLELSNVYVGYHGRADVCFGKQKMEIPLDDDECTQIRALTLGFIQAKQQKIADDIATAQPALLPAPNCVDGEFTEV